MLVALLRKQIITLKLQKLKISLIIIIMINILLLQSLILQPQMFLMQDQRKQIQLQKQILIITVSSLDSKIATNKTKNESIEKEFKKLKTFDASYFIGKSHFEEDGTQNYLVFQPIRRYFKLIAIHYILLYGNLKDYLLKLLSLLLRLIIVLLRYLIMSVTK